MNVIRRKLALVAAAFVTSVAAMALASKNFPVIAAQDPAKVEAAKKKKEAEAAAAAERAKAEREKKDAAEKAAQDAQSEKTKALIERKKREMSAAEAADRAAGGGEDSAVNKKAIEKVEEKIIITDEARAEAAKVAATRSLADAAKVEKGKLFNPFTDNKAAITEGKQLYLDYSCNGCHGGGGGGGMCPPLTNERFVYGSDDDTIFRLIAIGTQELQKAGFKRIAKEAVTGPMPPYVEIIEKEEELWKIIAYIRSVYRGRAKKRNW